MGTIRTFGTRTPVFARIPLGLVVLLVFCAGCHRVQPIDTQSLDSSGMSYDTIAQLKSLGITSTEVPEIAQARQAGFSDAACLQTFQIYRSRKQSFDVGDAITGLIGAGASEDLVLNLAHINQLGLGAGELEAMRLAGLSDNILLAVAKHHAAGQSVLSGASLAGMKNLGMRSDTLLQLAQRGIPESQAATIMSERRHGANDAKILRQFAGS
jgi:hypothetical protein